VQEAMEWAIKNNLELMLLFCDLKNLLIGLSGVFYFWLCKSWILHDMDKVGVFILWAIFFNGEK
jgi:hypothetical protein